MEDSTQTAPYSRRLEAETGFWTMGMLGAWLAEGEDTGGTFALAEAVVPRGAEPPPHTHTREDEAFYILEGEMSVSIGGCNLKAGPGDLVYLPRGIEHGFKPEAPTVRALFLITPAGLEGAFKQLGEPARDLTLPSPPEEPPDVGHVMDVFGAYGVEFVPAPEVAKPRQVGTSRKEPDAW